MGGKGRHCEACGVRESLRGGFFASFPKDELRCKIWVKQVGKEDLVHVPIEKLHEVRHVCGDHFEKRDFGKTGKRLKKRAYPKLHLMAPPLSDNQMKDFPQHVASKQVSCTNTAIPEMSPPVEIDLQPVPSTSRTPLSTSVRQNMNDSIPAKRPRLENEALVSNNSAVAGPSNTEPTNQKADPISAKWPRFKNEGLVANSASVTGPPKTEPAHPKTDCNNKAKLLKQLQGMKATIKSLRKHAKIMENLESPFLKEIVSLAIKNRKRKPRGYRWTMKYKISCLAILKRSPKAYRYLQHLMPVPSVKTLQNILRKVPMEPGISKAILEHLRRAAISKIDKYCCLLFDEIAIKPRLNYNVGTDKVDGYTDMGKMERNNSLADHALVFMLQGIRKKYKQPLAFYFVKGTVSSRKLAELIMEIIHEVNKTGFQVLATVCDQGPTNMGALKILKDSCPSEEGPSIKNYFVIDEKKVFIVYDVPHLFKSIRNNFMNYGEMKMGGKKAKWVHLKKVEERNRNLLFLSKISLKHVEPRYRAKMKVKYAAQVLSNTVAAVLKLLALAEDNPNCKKELHETGEIIHELDRLFDLTNGPSGPDDIKKGLRENVSNQTNHLNAWAHYRKIIESLSFNKESGIRAKNVRCIQGYLTTLCSLRDIWIEVQRLGFKYLNLRQLNQDALENLFGVIRQHSPTNRHPTVTTFVAALKSSIISGMSAPHSRGSNCTKDANQLMTDLHNLIFDSGSNPEEHEATEATAENTENTFSNKENEDPDFFTLHIPEEEELDDDAKNLISVDGQPIVYLSGYLAMTILKNHDCPACKEALIENNPADDPSFAYIKLREWWKDTSSLTYPNKNLSTFVSKCATIFEGEIIPILHQCNISSQTVTLFLCHSDGAFIKCDLHRNKIFHAIAMRLAVMLIRRQCKRLNSTLSAQEEELADKCKKHEQHGAAVI